MSIAVTVQEAQTKLHELINLIESGEEVFFSFQRFPLECLQGRSASRAARATQSAFPRKAWERENRVPA
jgi:hypothetical protein